FPPVHTECDKAHGRVEVRRIQVAEATSVSFPGARQVFRIERETWRGSSGAHRLEVSYGITSLGAECADPARLLRLSRGHWTIENRSHYVRDVTFGEDACRIRCGRGPHTLAALRNAAIGIVRLCGGREIASSLRAFGW